MVLVWNVRQTKETPFVVAYQKLLFKYATECDAVSSPRDDVKAIRFGRRFKSGDQVRAALPVSLRLVSVIRAMDDGVRYEVGWSQTRRSVVAFSALAPP